MRADGASKWQTKQARVHKKNVVVARAGEVEAPKPYRFHVLDCSHDLLALFGMHKIVKFNRNLRDVGGVSQRGEQLQLSTLDIQLQEVNRFEALFGKEIL